MRDEVKHRSRCWEGKEDLVMLVINFYSLLKKGTRLEILQEGQSGHGLIYRFQGKFTQGFAGLEQRLMSMRGREQAYHQQP